MSIKSLLTEFSCLLAILVFASGCDPGPVTSMDFYLLALKEMNANNHEVALQHCNTAIELQPDSYEAYQVRSVVYEAMGKSTEAEADWQKMFDLAPDDGVREDLMKERNRKNKAKEAAELPDTPEVEELEESSAEEASPVENITEKPEAPSPEEVPSEKTQ